jgi:hypothetical protein
MSAPRSDNLTRLLEHPRGGDQAAACLLPMIYDELRAQAGSLLPAERPDRTLDPIARVRPRRHQSPDRDVPQREVE